MKVLVIDDSEDNRELYKMALSASGHDVSSCATADEALVHLGEHGVPDLILCDLMMPGMDGDQFVLQLKKHPEWSSICVIIMSAVESLHRRAWEMGADGFLKKPFTLEELENRVSQALKGRVKVVPG